MRAVSNDPKKAIRLYTWNIEVSAALWGSLHAIEIGLRNALHERMCLHFGRPDWWSATSLDLMFDQRDQLARAVDKLRRRRPGHLPGHVVAELTFGFWIGLLGKGRDYEKRLWTPALRRAFPNYRGSRGDLYAAFDSVRLLRNRIAHHEPVFGRSLRDDHRAMLILAAYIDTDLGRYIAGSSRFHLVMSKRFESVRTGELAGF